MDAVKVVAGEALETRVEAENTLLAVRTTIVASKSVKKAVGARTGSGHAHEGDGRGHSGSGKDKLSGEGKNGGGSGSITRGLDGKRPDKGDYGGGDCGLREAVVECRKADTTECHEAEVETIDRGVLELRLD